MPAWVPEWFVNFAAGVTLVDILVWVGAGTAVVLFLRKVGPWFIVFAKAVINTAQIIDSVKELPAFIDRTDKTLGEQNDSLEAHGKTLAVQDERIAEIHHETHTNNGSSIKDAVVRIEEVVNTQILPELKTLTASGDQLRQDFEDSQGVAEVHVAVHPKAPKGTPTSNKETP